MPPQTFFVFVYGTLRKGSSNHGLLRTAKFLGKATTMQPYALYLGEYPCVYKDEPHSRITGEVYAVDKATFARLDALEEHPQVYCREQIEVLLDSGEHLTCWLYFYPRQEGARCATGDYFTAYPES